jgi:ParB family transcriptional regulator, chromosome partitioning protein
MDGLVAPCKCPSETTQSFAELNTSLLEENTMPELLVKPLSWFKVDPNQPRKSFDEEELQRLGDDMLARGVLIPLLAKPDGTIIDGERRWRAAQLEAKGIEELPVIVTEKPEKEIRGIQLATVFHKADLNFCEKWLACSELMCAHPDWEMRTLAAFLHVDPSMVTRLLSPSKCTPAWQEAFKAGKVSLSDIYGASKNPAASQDGLLDLRLSGQIKNRDDLERAGRKNRSHVPAVKMAKVKIAFPNKVSVVLNGVDLGMSEVVAILTDALREARKAVDRYDVKTFMAMMKDESRKRA